MVFITSLESKGVSTWQESLRFAPWSCGLANFPSTSRAVRSLNFRISMISPAPPNGLSSKSSSWLLAMNLEERVVDLEPTPTVTGMVGKGAWEK